MTKNLTDPIPSRLRLSQTTAKAVAKSLFDRLISGWGLANASVIVKTLNGMVKTEKKRRKELEDK